MLQDVRTPLLSGIPYMFRFAAPRDTNAPPTIGEDRNLMRWVPAKIENFDAMGLKARYSQALFNPATIGCSAMIVAAFVLKTFMVSLSDSAMSYEYLRCSASSLEGSYYGNFYQYSKGVMQILNQSNSQAIQQYFYTVNATLWNLQASSSQYAGLLGAYYQTIDSGIPGGAYLASVNVSTILCDWASSELKNASRYTDKLLHDISSAMSELGGSAANVSNTISTTCPTGINTQLKNFYREGNQFYNLTYNAQAQLDALFANASANVTDIFKTMKGLATEINLIPQVYEASGCHSVITQSVSMGRKLNSQFKLQAALFGLVALVFTAVSVLYTSRKWRGKRIILSEVCAMGRNTPRGVAKNLHMYECLVVGYIQKLVDNWPGRASGAVKWILDFMLSRALTTLLAVGWVFIVLSLCVSSMLKAMDSTVMVNTTSPLPNYVSVSNRTISISASDLNTQISSLEQDMNNKITILLTDLVTNVNSIVSTVNETMASTSTQTLESLNLTSIPSGLDFSLIYEDGFAVQEITLCRLPSEMNVTSTAGAGIFGTSHAFGFQNVTNTVSQVERALKATGLVLVSMWLGCLVLSTIYVTTAIHMA